MPAPILTKHARERLQQRWITESAIESVLRSPDRTEPGSKPGTTKFIRTLNGRQIQLIGTYLQDQDRWLIVSAWVRGEDDQPPLAWTIITLPFKLTWSLIKWLWRTSKKSSQSRRH
jgi:hypothetical protein